MNKLFGTDGVRGIANKDLTADLAHKISKYGGYFLTKDIKKRKPKILLGTDTRISKDMLDGAITSGLTSMGIDVLFAGVIPTPGVAFLTRYFEADGGIVISASHNPVEYNGIKFFDKNGYKLKEKEEEEIENLIFQEEILEMQINNGLGRKISLNNATEIYVKHIKNSLDRDLSGLKIALDCGNGASYKAAPLLFEKLGAEVYVLNSYPNGVNINVNCGSTCPNEIKTFVIETNADLGLSFDGDADRVIAVDEKGNIINGDKIMAALAVNMKKKHQLNSNTLVSTLMSNLGLDIYLKDNEINIIKTAVGDRNVLTEMKKNKYSLGGEQSGHIILLDYNTTGDGMLTGAKLAEILKNENIKSSNLAEEMENLPQTLKNAQVSNGNKYKYKNDEEIMNHIKIIEDEFSGKGRVFIRPSGTEPVVRVMIEGENQRNIEDKAMGLVEIIENKYK